LKIEIAVKIDQYLKTGNIKRAYSFGFGRILSYKTGLSYVIK